MKIFTDISGLHRALQIAFESGPGEPGRTLFANALVNELEFSAQQASLYASVVLSQNVEASADWVRTNVLDVSGTWIHMESSGMAAALLSTKTETWTFDADLTYNYKLETYEGYSSPFGSSYAIPKSSPEAGFWAPADRLGDEVAIVAIASGGWTRKLSLAWLDQGELRHRRCTIDGKEFSRR